MPQSERIVGIDVSKRRVEACLRARRERLSQPSTPEGRQAMIAWLRQHDVAVAVMEASGGYERDWAAALRGAGIAVRIVDPKRVRYFARSAGRLAKNDPIDAEMIAWFAETFAPAAAPAHDPEREAVDRLMTVRAMLVRLESQIGQLGEHRQPPLVERAGRVIAGVIVRQRKRLETAIAARIARQADWAERHRIIQSVPGFGPRCAAGIIAWLPELGQIGGKPATALVGLAPYDDDSGGHRGERHIKGGRREIRDLLYMAALAATRCNPVIKAHYQQLRARGKKFKVALVACMRKLMVILNTMLMRGQMWNPPAVAVA